MYVLTKPPVILNSQLAPEPGFLYPPGRGVSGGSDWSDVVVKGPLFVGAAWLTAEVFRGLSLPRSNRAPRNTYRYGLSEGNTNVQYGITNDPLRRRAEHAADGKRFTSMRILGPVVTRQSALAWERASIEGYQRRHGRRPRYNKV
jgi:predicted GIY-YIG superfamily endonuclease